MNTTSHKLLTCIVVTPERAVLDVAAEFVALPMYDGELGVLPGRAPLIGRLGFGELRLRLAGPGVHVAHSGATGELKPDHSGRSVSYFVDGGFAQIRNDVVTVLTQRAIPAAELSVEDAERQLAAAKATVAQSPDDRAARTHAEERARSQARVARKLHVG